jgi:SAM-dependent methyltransferase
VTAASEVPAAWPLPAAPLSPEQVWDARYPDFVAMINQTNVMPGAYATLSTWALHSRMDERSTLLEVACTTGFTSRELAKLIGCRAVGFDLSPHAVALARYNHQATDPALDLQYVQADGRTFAPDRTFSHVAVGAALGFFPDPPAIADRIVKMIDDGGYVLASPFWCDHDLPAEAVTVRREMFGISSPMETRAEAIDLFRGLHVIYQADHTPIPETNDQIAHYCHSTIDRACRQSGIQDPLIRQAMIERLHAVKNATNLLRAHQRYTVLVLRYDAATYPHRYVELF